MSAIAESHKMRLPGNRLTRTVAGLPVAPQQGEIDFRWGEQISTAQVLADPLDVLGISADQAIPAPSIVEPAAVSFSGQPFTEEIHVGVWRFPVFEIPLDQLIAGRVDGTLFDVGRTLFDKERKIGQPSEDSRLSDSAKRLAGSRQPVTSLLSKLLPVLLPPARAQFGEVFALPHDLYPFQPAGIKWLTEQAPGALLADDMGLGKTVQAIVAMRHLFRKGEVTRALVVAPKSVVTSWKRHLDEWAPELQVQKIAGSALDRRFQWDALATDRGHVGIVTYASLVRDDELALTQDFDLVIADEVQKIKNLGTQQSQVLRGLSSRRRWGLTGTPLETRVEDLATILRFIDPSLMSRSDPTEAQVKEAARKVMLRRRKEDVLDDLPPIVHHLEHVELLPKQREVYDEAERTGISRLKGQETTITNVLALITALKQICNGYDGESAKLDRLVERLEVASEEGDRTIVFSQYVQTIRQVEQSLARFQPLTYAGDMSTPQRERVVQSFLDNRSKEVMLLSLKAGGTGLDRLQYAANRVIHFDSWWNPAVMSQATARLHRIGQEKKVFETTFISVDTVEERIQVKLDEKRDLFSRVVDDLSTDGLAKVLSEEELFSLFGLAPPRRAAAPREQPEKAATPVEPAVTGAVVSPATPYGNVVHLLRIMRNLKGVVWWSDPNFSQRPLEDLQQELNTTAVKEIRIMSREASPRDVRLFGRFREQMRHTGITTEWRVSESKLFHDRYLADDSMCFNMPPVNLIYGPNAPYSEISPAVSRPPFEEWWQKSVPILELGKDPQSADRAG